MSEGQGIEPLEVKMQVNEPGGPQTVSKALKQSVSSQALLEDDAKQGVLSANQSFAESWAGKSWEEGFGSMESLPEADYPGAPGGPKKIIKKVDLTKRQEDVVEEPKDLFTRIKTFFYNDYYVPREAIRAEITAGLIVGLAVVPEAIAFALVVGIRPQWGVDTTLITTFVVGVFGGRPGLCNGASGAVAVVIVDVVQQYGVEYMGYTVVLAGLFCILFGVLRLANFMTLISSSVMIGFVNALAIIIGCAQVKTFKRDIDLGGGGTGRRLLSSFDVFVDGEAWVDGETAGWMLLEVGVCMLTMVLLPMIKHEKLKWIHNIPSSLIGILLATAVEHGIVRPAGAETRTIGDLGEMTGALPRSLWDRGYEVPELNGDTISKILPTAGTLAAVALIEQMMTLQLVDAMTKTVGQANREAVGLGLGNIVAGLFGGMGGNAMIGQSVICIKTGGFRRLSNLMTGFTVLLISVSLFKVVNLMPSAAFVGMMWMICYYTFEWNTFILVFHALQNEGMREKYGRHKKIERSDVLVIVVVTVTTLFSNLATAVAAGLVLNLIAYAIKSGEAIRVKGKYLVVPSEEAHKLNGNGNHSAEENGVSQDENGLPVAPKGTAVYDVEGPLFFGSVKKFMSLFDFDNDPEDVELHCSQFAIMDYSATEALVKLAEEYSSKGKKLHLKYLSHEQFRYLRKVRKNLEGISSWETRHTVDKNEVDLAEMKESVMEPMRNRNPDNA